MPDGKRKRRHSQNKAKHQWYAFFRSLRFARRFGGMALSPDYARPPLRLGR